MNRTLATNLGWTFAGLAGTAALMALSSRPVMIRGGGELLHHPAQYEAANRHSVEMALGLIQELEQGATLTETGKERLRSAVRDFRSMLAYEPRQVGSNFACAKCLEFLGETRSAVQHYEQAVLNVNIDPENDKNVVNQTVVESQSRLGYLYLDLAETAENPKHRRIYADKANTFAGAAALSSPQNAAYGLVNAITLHAIGAKEKALAEFRRASALVDPKSREDTIALKRAKIVLGLP